MIDLHYWTTPNGHKITIFLEEARVPYRIIPVDIGIGDQFKPDFLAIAPNNRIPAIMDTAPAGGGSPISLFESGAILVYLAEKTGQFLPFDVRGKYEVLQWLFWQMAGPGPMAGQNDDFPHLKRWFETMRARPAVKRAYEIAREINARPVVSEDRKPSCSARPPRQSRVETVVASRGRNTRKGAGASTQL
jgi:glutathione S-transferase